MTRMQILLWCDRIVERRRRESQAIKSASGKEPTEKESPKRPVKMDLFAFAKKIDPAVASKIDKGEKKNG